MDNIILDKFEKYLVERGYKQITPSGLPSTTYSYSKARVPKICKREGVSVKQLADNIRYYIKKYDSGGSESKFGNKSNRAFINALKRFEEFINSTLNKGDIQ